MNSLLRTIILASITIPIFSITSLAQPPGDAAFKKVKLLKVRLALTDKQADSIYTILQKYDYKTCDGVASFTKKSECFKNVHATKQEKMTSVLSETQKAELEDFIIECQQNHGPKKDDATKAKSGQVSCSKSDR